MRFFCLLILIFSLDCAPNRPDPSNSKYDGSAPVLIIDGEEISLDEFRRRIKALPEFASSRLSSIEAQRVHLSGVAQFEVLANYAIKTGHTKDPELMKALDNAIFNAWIGSQKIEITPEEIDIEITKTQQKVHYAIAYRGERCEALKSTIGQLPPEIRAKSLIKHVEEKGNIANIFSFSTRPSEAEIKNKEDKFFRKALLVNETVGTLIELPSPTCAFAILTKIVREKKDRLNIENQLRKQKKIQFKKEFKNRKK